MTEQDRQELIKRFWELQEPDLDAYSRRIGQLLEAVSFEELGAIVMGMEGSRPDEDEESDSDGPAINCPGHTADTDCEDYPGGACDACNEAEDEAQRLRDQR